MPRCPPRYSPAAHRILEYCLAAPTRWFHGYTLLQQLDLSSGTLYPALMRLAEAGWLETAWESAGRGGRPPRHRYRLAPGAAADVRALLRPWRERGRPTPALRHAT
jgi:DNA-binding PadR family transcriptional regulator